MEEEEEEEEEDQRQKNASKVDGTVGQINQNPDISTGPFAHSFAHSLAPFTCLLAHSLCS